MNGENTDNKHATVGTSYQTDQRAVKVFLDWLPDDWIPRKQEPDFFIDYLVELTEKNEPSGLHFGAQIKGRRENEEADQPLSYAFKTKHLKYYLHRSKNPVFLFLINVTTQEGFWVFAQKYLKENISEKILDEQKTITVHFSQEDNLFNLTKFKYSLPTAEKFVRDLHPGSIHAALQKRKQELESKDPRCSVSISVKDGKEQITINPKETFSFQTKIRSKNIEGWRNFIECGAEVKVEPNEIEILGAPILAEMNLTGGHWKFQFGSELPASIQVILETSTKPTFIQLNGRVRAGTKFMTFDCCLQDSALEIRGQVPFKIEDESAASVTFSFTLDKWIGQPLMLLSHFSQVETIIRALSASEVPKMELSVQGNVVWGGSLRGIEPEIVSSLLSTIEWLEKCKWIAAHYKINPPLPDFGALSNEQWDFIDELYALLKNKEYSIPQPGRIFSFEGSNLIPPDKIQTKDDGYFRLTNDEKTVDFFTTKVPLGPTEIHYSNLKFISQTPLSTNRIKFVFETTEKTVRRGILL